METVNVFEMLSNICRPLPVMELAAIWLERPLKMSDHTSRRITEGDFVYCENGELKDCYLPPTHCITSLRGRGNSDFEISVMDIKTKELQKIKL